MLLCNYILSGEVFARKLGINSDKCANHTKKPQRFDVFQGVKAFFKSDVLYCPGLTPLVLQVTWMTLISIKINVFIGTYSGGTESHK